MWPVRYQCAAVRSLILLRVDVPLDCLGRHGASRANVIASRPHMREFTGEAWKFTTQHKGGVALQPMHDLVWGKRGRETTEQVNVIRLDSEIQNLSTEFDRLFVKEDFQSFRNSASKNRPAIFRSKYKMIVDLVGCVPCSFCFHRTSVLRRSWIVKLG